jgi:WhiB family redox-sensing transcriptional regulator
MSASRNRSLRGLSCRHVRPRLCLGGVMDDKSLWRDSACRGADPELSSPLTESGPSLVQIRQARQICRMCEAQRACLMWALQHAMDEGICGGSTETERRAIVAGLNGARSSPGPAPRAQSGTWRERS